MTGEDVKMKDAVYLSMDFKVTKDMAIFHLPTPPNKGRLNRILGMCGLELVGEPFIHEGCWAHNLKESA
jgi:hypothetical protein